MDAQTEFRQLCDKMSQETMKPFMVQKENIYIDSDLLYDYRLGAVLALTRGEADYNYVLAHLNAYLKAPTLECAKFFPDLHLTEEQLDKVIMDPNYFVFMNAAAPATEFFNDLEKIIRIFNTINESKEVTRPLHITINQRRIKIHDVYKRQLENRIHRTDPSVIVEFTEYASWNDVPQTLIEVQDLICVYDMIEFLQEGTNSQKALAKIPSKLCRTCIATLLQSDKENPTLDDFTNLQRMLECMCMKLSFRPKTVLSKELING